MNISKSKVLSRFLLRLLIWLPLSFAAWYLLAGYLIVPVGWFTSLWLEIFASGKIESITASDKLLIIKTHLEAATPDGRMGYLLLEINPLSYCWSFPLLMAMTLSAGMQHMLGFRLAGGFIALLPFQGFGVVFELLKLATIQYGPEISSQMGYGSLGREFIALGYQFGFLMLPVISTSAIWIVMHRWFIQDVIAVEEK